MTISTKTIIDKINSRLASTGLTATAQSQLIGAANALSLAVVSVPTELDLPLAAENSGRLIYVESLNSYRYSNGTQWIKDYDSTLVSIGYIWAWGSNICGQFGDNTLVSKSSPVSVVGGFTDWYQVSASELHSAAVRTNGTLWTWGRNNFGQLGDGGGVDKSSPVSVVGGFTDWCQVATGAGPFGNTGMTAAVRTNGTLWTWGRNNFGQLGDGTAVSKLSPVSVIGEFTDWCQVSTSGYQTAAVRTNGTLWSWGYGSSGQLGDGTVVDKSSPVSVLGGFTDWCQVSAGNCHTAAVRTNGTLWSWGNGSGGQLGDGTSVSKSSPVSVVGGFTDWCQVSTIRLHSAALRTNGTLWSWGFGTFGQLGDGTNVTKSSPVLVSGGFTDWCQVSAGRYHTSALRTNGSLWSWGRATAGQLGDGTAVTKSSPVSVGGGFTDWCQVSAGGIHTSAIRSTLIKGF